MSAVWSQVDPGAPLVGPVSPVLAALFVLLTIATVADLRARRVPLWLTAGGTAAGLLLAATGRPGAFQESIAGLLIGLAVLLPLVLRGGVGDADALLLGMVGAWQGWWFVLWTALWMALAGGPLALVAVRRGQRAFPYAPAIAAGAVAALLTA
ncbi:MAG: prepilin peptidase [Chloroflexota bacterium]